jgi:DNA-binding beta-propeller fold protein YncE
MMKKRTNLIEIFLIICAVMFLYFSCGEKFPLPPAPEGQSNLPGISDTTYIQQYPNWEPASGFDFNSPTDILVGNEPFIYVTDSVNNRVVMLDLAGNIIGSSQTIPGPVAISQDGRLNLIVVNNTNKIYKIDLFSAQHNISAAPVRIAYHDVDHPNRRFSSVAAWHGTESGSAYLEQWYYVSVNGPEKRDNAIFYFAPKNDTADSPIGPINMEPNGTGMFSTANPSGITITQSFNSSTRFFDFIFCQTGLNFYKVQWITSNIYGFALRLDPSISPTAIFAQDKFSQPEDVTIDEQGNIFVVDAGLHRLFRFNSSGVEKYSFGSFGSGEKQFHRPMGVAYFDKTIYVADTGNNRILRFKLSTDI